MGGFLAIDQSLPFPGAWALLPVLGTVSLIVAGMVPAGPLGVSWLISTAPFRWLGELSYSLYLWHWPALILLPLALPDWPPLLVVLLALALALLLAALSYRFVENPIRHAPPLRASAAKSVAVGLAFTLAATLVPVSGYAGGASFEAEHSELAEAREGEGDDEESDSAKTIGAARAVLNEAGNGELTVLLVGDSHADHWRKAFDRAVTGLGGVFAAITKSSCPTIDIVTVNTRGSRTSQSCQDLRVWTRDLIAEFQPDIVVLSLAEGYLGRIRADDGSEVSEEEQLALWGERYAAWISEVSPHTGALAVVIDNPRLPEGVDPNECLAEAEDPEDCAMPRDIVLAETSRLQQASAEARAEAGGVAGEFSVTDQICGPELCRVMDGETPIYRDYNHLSGSWTVAQQPRVEEFIRALASA